MVNGKVHTGMIDFTAAQEQPFCHRIAFGIGVDDGATAHIALVADHLVHRNFDSGDFEGHLEELRGELLVDVFPDVVRKPLFLEKVKHKCVLLCLYPKCSKWDIQWQPMPKMDQIWYFKGQNSKKDPFLGPF